MEIKREDIKIVIELLNKAFEFEGDVFGVLHNTAIDTLRTLDFLLEFGENS